MAEWLSENLINIVIIAAIALICFFIIRGMIKNRRAGKSSCAGCSGCGTGSCSGCALSGGCHKG